MARDHVLCILLLTTSAASAESIFTVGTYDLSHSTQGLSGDSLQFHDMSSTTVGLALDAVPMKGVTSLSYGVEVFHVGDDINQQIEPPGDAQIINSGLLANLKWRLLRHAMLRPFIGVGAGLTYVDYDMRATSTNYHYGESVGLAGQAFGGLEWQTPRSRFGLLGELKYYSVASHENAAGTAAFIGFSMQLD